MDFGYIVKHRIKIKCKDNLIPETLISEKVVEYEGDVDINYYCCSWKSLQNLRRG